MSRHRVIILGGGFAGLSAARALGRAAVEVTLIDRRNFHLFQPLLYQVATGDLSPGDISSPLRAVLKRQANTTVLQNEVSDLAPAGRRVILDEGAVEYDTLIVATGVTHHYFGHDDWEAHAPGLKTVEDATRIRSRILEAFERAEKVRSAAEREELLTFVIVGGGPTGVEMAGAIGELARHTLRREFRRFDPGGTRVQLVEMAPRILQGYSERLSHAATRSLEKLGVRVLTGTSVDEVDAGGVRVRSGDDVSRIAAATVVWAAGVKASRLARILAERTGVELDRVGRVRVAPDGSVPGHPEILVIGDLARLDREDGSEVPGVAPAAMQQGVHAARLVRDRLAGRKTPVFRYRDKGSLAVIGRAAAVARLGRLQFTGYPAWLLWLFVHIMSLVEYENRAVVFVQWAFNYFTRKRGARLITR